MDEDRSDIDKEIALTEELIARQGAIYEWGRSEHRDFRERSDRARTLRFTIRAQFMLLAGAIVGVVAPLLARDAVLVGRHAMSMTSICMLISMVIATVSQFIEGRMYKDLADRFSKGTSARMEVRRFVSQKLAMGEQIPTKDISPFIRSGTGGRGQDRNCRSCAKHVQHVERPAVLRSVCAGLTHSRCRVRSRRAG